MIKMLLKLLETGLLIKNYFVDVPRKNPVLRMILEKKSTFF